MSSKALRPLETTPEPSYPVPLLWQRTGVGARLRRAVATCSAGLCLTGCGAALQDEQPPSPPAAAAQGTGPEAPEIGPRVSSQAPGEREERVSIVFRDEMGRSFQIVRMAFALDGQRVLERELHEDEDEDLPREVTVLDAPLAEGEHEVAVHLEYRGVPFGTMGYFVRVTFTVRSSHRLEVRHGRPGSLVVTAFEQGGVTTPLEERPAVRFAWEDLPAR